MNKAFSKLAYKIYVLYLLVTGLNSEYEPLPARYSVHMFLMRQRRLIGVGRILRRVEKPPQPRLFQGVDAIGRSVWKVWGREGSSRMRSGSKWKLRPRLCTLLGHIIQRRCSGPSPGRYNPVVELVGLGGEQGRRLMWFHQLGLCQRCRKPPRPSQYPSRFYWGFTALKRWRNECACGKMFRCFVVAGFMNMRRQ